MVHLGSWLTHSCPSKVLTSCILHFSRVKAGGSQLFLKVLKDGRRCSACTHINETW